MDALKGLNKKGNGSDTSEEPTLVSELLRERNNYLLPDEIAKIFSYAKAITELQPRESEDEEWLKDFASNLPIMFAAERELNEKVAGRRNPDMKTFRPVEQETIVNTSGISAFNFTESQDAIPSSINIQPVGPMISLDDPKPSGSRIKPPIPERSFEQLALKPPILNPERLSPIPFRAPALDMSKLNIKPDRFEGQKALARTWLEDFEQAADANNWSNQWKMHFFPAFLAKTARNWFTAIAKPKMNRNTTWVDMRSSFLRYFVGPEEQQALEDQINETKQGINEPATEFIANYIKLLTIAFPSMSEKEKVRKVRNKLRNDIKGKMVGQHPATVEGLSDLCAEAESQLDAERRSRPTLGKRFERMNFRDQGSAQRPDQDKEVRTKDAPDAEKRVSKEDQETKPKYREPLLCTHCNKTGHLVEYCFLKNGRPRTTTKPRKVAAIEETESDEEAAPRVATLRHICSVVAMAKDEVPDGIYTPVKLNELEFSGFVDSGSRISLISAKVALALKLTPDGCQVPLYSAFLQSANSSCLGWVRIKFSLRLGDVTKEAEEVKFLVVDNLCAPVLCGKQLLGWLKVAISMSSSRLWFEDEAQGMRLLEDVELVSRSEQIVRAKVPREVPVGSVVATIPFQFNNSILVANTVDTVDSNHHVNCLVANLELNNLRLSKDLQLACFELKVENKEKPELIRAVRKLADTNEIIGIGEDLTEEQIVELHELLNNHLDAFSINGQIGETKVVEHDICLEEGALPVVHPLRRRPLAHRMEAKRQVDRMLEEGIVEPSSSPWGFAYVLVKKKGGDMRLCVDFRMLNEKTKKNVFPLPNIEDCLEPLSGNRYFSQLDLASGYWQIRMAEKAKEMTAFRTEDGLFQFKRMPFGLCNAPASFQRLVNALFTGLKGVHLQVFIDDICIASQTWDEHLILLEKVFIILERANLKLKANKCMFAASKVIFLGHELSFEGIRQDPAKLKAISQMPAPRDSSGVRRVLGLFNYYRRFVPNFAQLAEPLNQLTKKNARFDWNVNCVAAFEELKKALCNNAILANFNHNDPLTLKTDASKAGIAAILLQLQKGEWKLITCCSRGLHKGEVNYGISELEGLAIVYAVQKLRNYILGKQFLILTDHCALCSLRKKNPNCARLRRWAILLSEFTFTIQYIKGGLHKDVDCLSRAPVSDDIDPYLDDKVFAVLTKKAPCKIVSAAIATARDDKEWKRLTENDAEAIPHLAKAKTRTKGYKLLGGLLYFENRLYVPKGKRQQLIEEAHSDDPACHGGTRATLERIQNLWWPMMSEDVRKLIESCAICQKRKAERAKPVGEMFSFNVVVPFQLIALDTLGPLPESLSQKKYVIVAIDCFTRFLDAVAVSNIQGETVAQFMNGFVGRFGIPDSILTDNGPEFCNAAVKAILSRYHIQHRKSTPNHHEGNAIAERVIQTFQEKLALITHDITHTIEWESHIPNAILSINTSYHNSTMFTPFELVYGKKHQLKTALIVEEDNPHSLYSELRELRGEISKSSALAAQFDAQTQSKQYFDERHREREYNIGDLVLARLMGRRTKLQNRFVGPYAIVKRERDVYIIESVDERRDRLQRHTRDLRPFVLRDQSQTTSVSNNPGRSDENESSANTDQTQSPNNTPSQSHNSSEIDEQVSTVINENISSEDMQVKSVVILLLIISPVAPIEFREAPVVSWLPTNIYVSPCPTIFKLGLHFGDPCSVLEQFQVAANQPDEASAAVHLCRQIYLREISTRLVHLAEITSYAPIVAVPQNLQPNVVVPENSVPYQQLNPGSHRITSPGQRRPSYSIINEKRLENVRIDKDQTRNKRSVTDFVLGSFVTNIVDVVIDRIWPSPAVKDLQERASEAAKVLGNMQHQANFTALEIMALKESHKLTVNLVENNIHQIDQIKTSYPRLTVVTADLISRIHLYGSYIERLKASFQARRPDLITLFLLLKFEPILSIDPNSINERSVRIYGPTPDLMIVEFEARVKSDDTKVMQVNAFRYWSDLTKRRAKLWEFGGPRYLVRNESCNCVEGIPHPTDSFITAECMEPNRVDNRLSFWKLVTESDSPETYPSHTEFVEIWPNVLVNCYGENITIGIETELCPPFPFILNATTHWQTNSYVYSPIVRVKNVAATLMSDISHYHMANFTLKLSKSKTITEVRRLNREVDKLLEDGKLFSVASYPIKYRESTYGLSGMVLALIVYLVIVIWRRGERLLAAEKEWRRANRRSSRENVRRERRELNQVYHELANAPRNEPRRNQMAIGWH